MRGTVDLPGDKSISHRTIFAGGIAEGKTTASNFLMAEDCLRTSSAFGAMGIAVSTKDKKITIEGKGLKGLKKPEGGLYLGNSGTTMRIIAGVLAGQDFETTLTGDESLTRRPMQRVIDPLRKMGISVRTKHNDGFPPVIVKGGDVKPIDYATKIASAQVKSCVLFAGLYANGMTKVTEPAISRNHTERMLEFFGADIKRKNLTVSLEGGKKLSGKSFHIPGDISSAAFFIAAACLLEGSEITLKGVGLNSTRMGFVNVLLRMGARISIADKKDAVEPYGDISVRYSKLRPAIIEPQEIPLLIDEVPVLAVLSSRTEGRTIIKGISELKVKETDRIFSITENLRRMGRDVSTEGENLVIDGNKKRFAAAVLDSFKDHRTAMSMAVAGLCALGDSRVNDADCIDTSFPEFFETLNHLAG